MAITHSNTRKSIVIATLILVCGLIGGSWGWYSSKSALKKTELASLKEKPQQDNSFNLPPLPPVTADQPKEKAIEDFSILRIWEISAHQPLPPRKEPLTSPNWKIVGVTTVGSDTNVLLLFDKQAEAETRKVGDLLPGGAKIIEITQDFLRINLNKEIMELRLRKQ